MNSDEVIEARAAWLLHVTTEKLLSDLRGDKRAHLSGLIADASVSSDPKVTAAYARYMAVLQTIEYITGKEEPEWT